MLLVPLTVSFILKFNSKQFDYSNECKLGKGDFGCVISAEVGGNEIAIKNQELSKEAIIDLTVILYSTSKSLKHVVPAVSATLKHMSITFGMPKMPTDGAIIWLGEPVGALKMIWDRIREQTLLDIIEGVKELNKVGIRHSDIRLPNILLDKEARAYVADFSTSLLVKPLNVSFYSKRKLDDDLFRDFDFTGIRVQNFYTFFKKLNIKVENDWEKILLEFKKPEEKAMTTVRMAELIGEGFFRMNDKN